MTDARAICFPSGDKTFAERVHDLVGGQTWDLDSPEGIALLQTLLRKRYPSATIMVPFERSSRTQNVVLAVHRDGFRLTAGLGLPWVSAVYDASGASAYREAMTIVGDPATAEDMVERAFRDVVRVAHPNLSVEMGGEAVLALVRELAKRAAGERAPSAVPVRPVPGMANLLAGLPGLGAAQRATIELAVREGLTTDGVAARMGLSRSTVHRLMNEALASLHTPVAPSVTTSLTAWRTELRAFDAMSKSHPERPVKAREVAHAWLDYQVVSGAIPAGTVVLVTDRDRRYVTASADAAWILARPSVVGLRVDDLTLESTRSGLPDIWAGFIAAGAMAGEYDAARPDGSPIRLRFRAFAGRPLPELQVSYLVPIASEADAGAAPSPGASTSPDVRWPVTA